MPEARSPGHVAASLLDACRAAGLRIVTAESCTGGLIAATLTEIAGSSDVVEGGFITYSNGAKIASLDVPALLLERHGAVSAEVATAMAGGALAHSQANLSVAVTGIAGPGGATESKPVGLVYIAAQRRGSACVVERHLFQGDRAGVRHASVMAALDLMRRLLP